MLNNIFLKTLRDQRRSLMWWAIAMVATAVFTILFYPSLKNSPEMDRMAEQMPEALRKAFLGEITQLTSPEGFLNSQLFIFFVPLLFLVFAVAQGSGAIAGEEQRGTLELLLSHPVKRRRVVLDKFAAMVVTTFVLALALWAGLLVGAAVVGMDISVLRLAEATFSGVLLGLAFGAMALALGCARGSRGLSIGVSSGLGAVAYLWNALSPLVASLEPYRKLSPFYYYYAADPLSNGLAPGHVAVLIGLMAALMVIAPLAFERRDLGT